MENNDRSPEWLSKFVDVYQSLNTDNVGNISQVYHTDIQFEDPMHKIDGLENLLEYFSKLYQNLSHCSFTITDYFSAKDRAAVYWTMSFKHESLNRGNAIEVIGHTLLQGVGDRVTYHRDYLDVGAMLYEHIPLLGSAVKFIKQRASR